jgi:tetratricopeptide (TPR) repeat protein
MTDLEWPDHHHVNATVGWLMLGNVVEARAEFERISDPTRRRPDVLEIEWSLLAGELRWEEAVGTAETQLAAMPDQPEPWIHRSFALHELRRTREAFERLLPAFERFPEVATIPYNLACYTCQLGDLPASRQWFARWLAFGKGPAEKLLRLQAALQDADLQPLWPELHQLAKEAPPDSKE